MVVLKAQQHGQRLETLVQQILGFYPRQCLRNSVGVAKSPKDIHSHEPSGDTHHVSVWKLQVSEVSLPSPATEQDL